MENKTVSNKNEENNQNFHNNLRDIRLAKILEQNNGSNMNYNKYDANLIIYNNQQDMLTPLIPKEHDDISPEPKPIFFNKGIIILGITTILLYTVVIYILFKYQ